VNDRPGTCACLSNREKKLVLVLGVLCWSSARRICVSTYRKMTCTFFCELVDYAKL
jgi:hypothetical protein